MAKTKISEFSPTPGNNTDIDGINIAEGCPPSSINNAIRELMAQLKDFQAGTAGDSFNGPVGTTTAAAGAFTTLTTSGAVTHNAGTANGVAFLNGSKVLTTGSALTFDGTNLGVGTASPTRFVDIEKNQNASTVLRIGNSTSGTGAYSALQLSSNTNTFLYSFSSGYTTSGIFAAGTTLLDAGGGGGLSFNAASVGIIFNTGSTEQMRLTSTGLGIKTSNPTSALTVGAGGTARFNRADNNTYNEIKYVSAGDLFYFNQDNGGAYQFNISTVEQMRLTSTGLGIGTSSPAAKLEVRGADAAARFRGSSIQYLDVIATSGGAVRLDANNGNAFVFAQNTTEQMRLDSSGNLGLGVTPSASWGSAWKAFEGPLGSFCSTGTGDGKTLMSSNAIENTTNGSSGAVYRYSGTHATQYEQGLGRHIWKTAGTGTAGNAISFTQALTLGADGNLLVGTTSNPATGRIGIQIGSTGSDIGLAIKALNNGNWAAGFYNSSGTNVGSIVINSSTTAYNTTSDYRLKTVIGPVADAGQRIDALQPVEYTWNASGERTRGFLAHQFQEVYAGSVSGTKDAVDAEGKPVYQSMQASSSEVIADLVAELQSLRARVAQLESN